ncbi:MAG: DUF6285 domain-containing protein [Hyphomicrobiaceae bacterium]
MRTRRIAAETLIELAQRTLEREIKPELNPNQRYALAMVLNALSIARREILTDGEQAIWELLDTCYPDGDGSIGRLAADIRSGEVADGMPPDLRDQLKQVLCEELVIKNPGFLKSRGIEA